MVARASEALIFPTRAWAKSSVKMREFWGRRPGSNERARGGLQAEHGLPLHEEDVVLRQEELRELSLGTAERLDERRVVVVGDLLAEAGEDALRRHRRARAQGEIGFAHLDLLS